MSPLGEIIAGAPVTYGGAEPLSVVVLQGGQGFVRRHSAERAAREARRVARLLPPGTGFALVGYDPAPGDGLTLEGIADGLAAALKGLERPPVLAAISFGGPVAMRLAARYPDMVRGVALIASADRFSEEGRARLGRQIAALEAGDWAEFLKEFGALFRSGFRNAAMGLMVRLMRKRIAAGMADPAAIVRYLELARAAGPVDLSAAKRPVLVLGGGKDQFFGAVMPEMAAGVSAGEIALLPRETHMAPVEAADAMRQRLGSWLARLG
ncbi:MAG: alpha/beta hydrolase [Micropepsaceae bacterium]